MVARIAGGSVMSRTATRKAYGYRWTRSETASGRRTVPTTRSPRTRRCSGSCRPKPLRTPVMSQVRVVTSCLACDAHERLDRAPLIHRVIPVDDVVEVGLGVEDVAWVDVTRQDHRGDV